ncbi:DUF1690 family protein [Schizosaccharomyces japonicus yFS275]|uniref:DUF1690 family protein n=1 Tax=Schizosaccharomyces japonicus (strain yFS275 / FY16936) TaxID=402676 RepID=B6JYH7_SCHJY|nr:DUF1690 family protein [Schizosaccharomyces japonicus yFS275]EEB06595.1 DUF1690 family protein [Schizosaccharomyces japonicus yFS275]
MGATNSRPEFVLRIPTEFSEQFINHIQNTTETDTTRNLDVEAYVQKRVKQELITLQERQAKVLHEMQRVEQEKGEKMQQKIPDFKDSPTLNSEIDKMRDNLQKELQSKPILDEEHAKKLSEIRSQLLLCLNENTEKSLLCRPIVKDLTNLVSQIQINSLNPQVCHECHH